MTFKATQAFLDQFEREKQICDLWFNAGLTDDDRQWVRAHLELAEIRVPTVDISWVTLGPA